MDDCGEREAEKSEVWRWLGNCIIGLISCILNCSYIDMLYCDYLIIDFFLYVEKEKIKCEWKRVFVK